MPALPANGNGTLMDATVPAAMVAGSLQDTDGDGCTRLDLRIEAGRIAEILPARRSEPGPDVVDLAGRMVWPSPIDMHTHLDKGHIWPRAANPDGSFMGALETVRADREANWRAADVMARMDFSLRCAYAHGTKAIRTHLDSIPPQDGISWPVFAEMRAAMGRADRAAGREPRSRRWTSRAMRDASVADIVAEHRGLMGLVPLMAPDLDAKLDQFFELAGTRGLDSRSACRRDRRPGGADAARRWPGQRSGPALPARSPAATAARSPSSPPTTWPRCSTSWPRRGSPSSRCRCATCTCRTADADRTPRWRGVTLLHELRARGIPVAIASDNTRDPFYAYGDLDLVEVFREAVRIMHLDHPIGDWPTLVASAPATIMGLAGCGMIEQGAAADLVVLEGRSYSEVLSRPQSRRTVLRRRAADRHDAARLRRARSSLCLTFTIASAGDRHERRCRIAGGAGRDRRRDPAAEGPQAQP